MKLLLAISLITFLFACSSRTKDLVLDHDYLKLIGDSIEIPGFRISLQLSSKAEKKLKLDKETIIVMAYFTGQPVIGVLEGHINNIDPLGGFLLCSSRKELTDERTILFEGIKFHKDFYYWLADKDINLLINVFSGRRANVNNILSGDILEDKMSNVVGKSFLLREKLIEE